MAIYIMLWFVIVEFLPKHEELSSQSELKENVSAADSTEEVASGAVENDNVAVETVLPEPIRQAQEVSLEDPETAEIELPEPRIDGAEHEEVLPGELELIEPEIIQLDLTVVEVEVDATGQGLAVEFALPDDMPKNSLSYTPSLLGESNTLVHGMSNEWPYSIITPASSIKSLKSRAGLNVPYATRWVPWTSFLSVSINHPSSLWVSSNKQIMTVTLKSKNKPKRIKENGYKKWRIRLQNEVDIHLRIKGLDVDGAADGLMQPIFYFDNDFKRNETWSLLIDPTAINGLAYDELYTVDSSLFSNADSVYDIGTTAASFYFYAANSNPDLSKDYYKFGVNHTKKANGKEFLQVTSVATIPVTTNVPEPSSAWLIGLGVIISVLKRRR